jgi:hypothetical protein
MASHSAVAEVLRFLRLAFPHMRRQPLEEGTLEAYHRVLIEVSDATLRQAAQECAADSKWFPPAGELRRRAMAIGALPDAPPPPGPTWSDLRADAVGLEEAYYHDDRLDPDAWEALALRFEAEGRPHGAAAIRRRLRVLAGQPVPESVGADEVEVGFADWLRTRFGAESVEAEP